MSLAPDHSPIGRPEHLPYTLHACVTLPAYVAICSSVRLRCYAYAKTVGFADGETVSGNVRLQVQTLLSLGQSFVLFAVFPLCESGELTVFPHPWVYMFDRICRLGNLPYLADTIELADVRLVTPSSWAH
jgi:hypothetical protein